MLNKIVPLVLMAGAAQTYTQKKGFGKMKGDLNSDGKMSGYEKARSKAIQKAILKKRNKKSSANTGSGKSAAHGKYKGK